MESIMDRLDAMSVLVAAIEAGTLSAAARRLGMPLATVSRKVSDLEAHLKTQLLNRSSRRLTLTDSGQAYFVACKRVLEDVDEAERAATGEYSAPKGNLVIAAPIVFGRMHVLPVASEFLKSYPDIDIRLRLADRVANLLEEHVDLAVRIGDLPDSSLIARRVGTIRQVICASPDYFAACGTPKSPRDLTGHACIAFEGLYLPDSWTFTIGRSPVPIAIHSRLVVNTAEAAIDAARAGIGLTRVLSYQIADAVRAGLLVAVLQDFEPPPWPVSLVHSGQRLLPQKLRAFLDFAGPRLKARVAHSALGEAHD
jgi:DNA-binding transcriptional LysR family regulator